MNKARKPKFLRVSGGIAESAPIVHNRRTYPQTPGDLMSGPLATARHGLIASLFLLLTMAPAVSAQSILDPARIEFTPSGSQSALDVRTGTPLIQSYALDIYVAGSATVVQRVNLGNPAPDPDGMIRVDFVQLLTTPLSTGVVYEAVVTTISPSETISSARSATFAFSAACTPGISPTSSDLTTSVAATGSVAVTANASCSWQATSNATWITITAGAYGSGNGTVSYSVAANTAPTSRTGTMTIGGQTFTVTRPAHPARSRFRRRLRTSLRRPRRPARSP